MTYVLNITPQPALRPSPVVRGKRVSMVNKPKYTQYKNTLSFLCRGKTIRVGENKITGVKIPKGDYYRIEADFYFPYPKATPKYKRIEGEPMRKKPDWDNCAKALQDALEQANVFKNDSQMSGARIDQWYTTEEVGRIEFKLQIYESQETK